MQERLLKAYLDETPTFLLPFLETKEMQRLKGVGMNCGVEYTSMPFLRDLPASSRYSHSLGVALLSYRYSKGKKEALAGLFHDIASPCFAHSIDFLKGDHLKQEKTEEDTASILSHSQQTRELLAKENISLDDIVDYSRYQVCDNPTPGLSGDRLEYTLRNIYLYGIGDLSEIRQFCSDLCYLPNEKGEMELQFETLEIANRFGLLSIPTFQLYVSKEDRYAMEMLANLLRELLRLSIIEENDLMMEEDALIQKIHSSEEGKRLWNHYRSLNRVDAFPYPLEGAVQIATKIRYIDPFVKGRGRLSQLDMGFKEKIDSLKATDFSLYLKGSYE